MSRNNLLIGFLILIIVNGTELRSGIPLSIIQVVLGGILIFLSIDKKDVNYRSLKFLVLQGLLIFSLIAGIYTKWYYAPNHLFLLTFITLVVILSGWNQNIDLIRKNFRWVFVILMGTATIYKIITPEFISSDFIGFRLIQGMFFRPIFATGLFPEINEQLLTNRELIRSALDQDPSIISSLNAHELTFPLEFVAKRFTELIIGGEMILTFMFLVFPWKRISLAFLWFFIVTIGLIVPEYEFASTLLFLGLIMCPSEFVVIKLGYLYGFMIYAAIAVSYNIFQILRVYF